MAGQFVLADEARTEELDWGTLRWICTPDTVGAEKITITQVWLKPGLGHDFHKHPDQEELITVLEGEVEQWLESEKRTLHPGDSIFIPAGVVHASFNSGSGKARMHVVLGPASARRATRSSTWRARSPGAACARRHFRTEHEPPRHETRRKRPITCQADNRTGAAETLAASSLRCQAPKRHGGATPQFGRTNSDPAQCGHGVRPASRLPDRRAPAGLVRARRDAARRDHARAALAGDIDSTACAPRPRPSRARRRWRSPPAPTPLAANLVRASELTALGDETILEIYTALRPRRSTAEELGALGRSPRARRTTPR